ncbi:hypothetical protein FOL47_007940 [Perkinsus chesapeaki]|uniref:Uncharacterized protein n=1 Tax=Perkinsus chesapeaki TaxID=330153 RepID=A0A7J6MUN7_PERCH|nr:hypothetical protein FOL47_007940 [Perkinsus chesapeaki]
MSEVSSEIKIYFASLFFDDNNEVQKILRGNIGGNDVARRQREQWEKLACDINSLFGVNYTSKNLKQMKEDMTRVVGRVATAHRQRLCAVKTGGGEPSEDPEPCTEPWLKAIEHHIFSTPRFVGLGDLEAGPQEKFDLINTFTNWLEDTKDMEKRFTTMKAYVDHVRVLQSQDKITLRDCFDDQQISNYVKNWKNRNGRPAEEVRAKAESDLLAKTKRIKKENKSTGALKAPVAVSSASSAVERAAEAMEEADRLATEVSDEIITDCPPPLARRKRTYAEAIDMVASAAEAVETYFRFMYRKAKVEKLDRATTTDNDGDDEGWTK